MKNNINWRIKESVDKTRFTIKRKFLNIFWYSFDCKEFFPIIIISALITALFAFALALFFDLAFVKYFTIFYSLVLIFLFLNNPLTFKSYYQAEEY